MVILSMIIFAHMFDARPTVAHDMCNYLAYPWAMHHGISCTTNALNPQANAVLGRVELEASAARLAAVHAELEAARAATQQAQVCRC